jgi:hypothetical protein
MTALTTLTNADLEGRQRCAVTYRTPKGGTAEVSVGWILERTDNYIIVAYKQRGVLQKPETIPMKRIISLQVMK